MLKFAVTACSMLPVLGRTRPPVMATPPGACCPADQACCGDGCIDRDLLPLVLCPVTVDCCEQDPDVIKCTDRCHRLSTVCGADGITYPSKCHAACARVDVEHDGRCEKDDCCPHNEVCCGGACHPAVSAVSLHCSFESDCCGDPAPSCEDECPANVQPVCGADGVTYPTECHAECAGVEVVSAGECPPDDCCPTGEFCCGTGCLPDGTQTFAPCGPSKCCDEPTCEEQCPLNVQPVCGVDGVTYESECVAECAGVEVASAGECPADDCCPKGEFCCGTGCLPDGAQTFAPCGPSKCCDEPTCEEQCPLNVQPVCGVDGVTYASSCVADCAGVDTAFAGECPPNNCCPEGKFCCGTECLTDGTEVFEPGCGPNACCGAAPAQ